MNPEVVSSYDVNYVALSFAIAFIGSFVALTAARRVVGPGGRINKFDLLSATLALGGIGVWTMHFIGMSALTMDLRVGYAMVETTASLLIVFLATGFALFHVAKDPGKLQRLLTAGVALGLGVGMMHYLGMYGMRFGGFIDWSISIVSASLLIAVVAATAALWLAFNTKPLSIRFIAAIVMAVAVCAMHYTGMAAANFVCTTENRMALPAGFGVITSSDLTTMVVFVAVGIALLLSVDLISQHYLSANTRKAPAQ